MLEKTYLSVDLSLELLEERKESTGAVSLVLLSLFSSFPPSFFFCHSLRLALHPSHFIHLRSFSFLWSRFSFPTHTARQRKPGKGKLTMEINENINKSMTFILSYLPVHTYESEYFINLRENYVVTVAPNWIYAIYCSRWVNSLVWSHVWLTWHVSLNYKSL